MATNHNFKVGDILHSQYHCAASFPMFYKVTRVTPCKVEVVRLPRYISRSLDPPYNQHGFMMPDPCSEPIGKPKLCIVGKNGVLVDSDCEEWADIWDGEEKEYYPD